MRNHLVFLLLFFICIQAPKQLAAQTIIKQNGKFGLADLQGNTIHKPVYDSIFRMSKFTDINLFYIKQNNKYAYCYYLEFDSTTWFNESQKKWITSPFEFDSLQGFWIGDLHYHSGFGYTTIGYKKNGLWGILFVQTHSGSGGGMFPSTGFYVDGLGKMTRRENKYDQILQSGNDYFYTTRLNDKYGFWEPTTNEVYEPEFDSIPLTVDKYRSIDYLPRHRYVKKNGKWGLVYLNKEIKNLEYKIPCMCNALGGGGGGDNELFYCMGQNDTLQIYDETTKETYMPLIDGEPLKTLFYWKSYDNKIFNLKDYIGSYSTILGSDSLYYQLTSVGNQAIAITRTENKKEAFPVLDTYIHNKTNSVFVVDLKNKSNVFAFTDTTFCYSVRSSLIIRARYDADKKIYIREFYDARTGALKYKIHSPEKYLYLATAKKETSNGEITWYKFISYATDKSDKGKIQGYYNLTTKKFSKRRK